MSEQELLRPSEQCYSIIQRWEGLMDGNPETVNLDPYLCPANIVTIGWGHAVLFDGAFLRGREGLLFARSQLYPEGITPEMARKLLQQDVGTAAAGVNRLVHTRINQNQFDALVSFAYNLGLDEDADEIAEGLGDSTLLKYVNRGQFHLAAGEFAKWVYSGGVVLQGLVNRRADERALFTKPISLAEGPAKSSIRYW